MFTDKLASLFGREQRAKLSASSLSEDGLRDTIVAEAEPEVARFQQLVENPPELPNTVTTTATTTWESFPEMARDVARAAFSYAEPEVRPRNEMLPSHAFNREVMAQIEASEEFQEVRHHASGDAHDALFSTLALQDALKRHAGEAAEHVERQNEAECVENELENIERALEDFKAQNADPADIEKLEAAHEQVQQELADIANAQAASGAAAVAQKIAATASKDMAEKARVMGAAFGIAPGMNETVSPEQRLDLADHWQRNPRLRRILEMVGRLKRDMRFKQQTRTKHVKIEPVGITTGRDIGRMLPHELARAFMPELRGLWAKDYSQRSLLEYEMAGKEPAGRGALVVVVDESESMKEYGKIEQAKAVQLACLSIAQREKRAFGGVAFSSQKQVASWEFPKGEAPDADMVLDMASHFFMGGTAIGAGLERAAELIRDSKPFKEADVVLITDGQSPFGERDQEIVNELRELNVRIHGLGVLAPNNAYLKQACDWHMEVAELIGEATDRLATELT